MRSNWVSVPTMSIANISTIMEMKKKLVPNFVLQYLQQKTISVTEKLAVCGRTMSLQQCKHSIDGIKKKKKSFDVT